MQPGEPESRFLTQLPALDIKNFLYHQGFQDVYHQMAHLPLNVPMSSRRIITKTIYQSSRPELAIVPLIRQMFARVVVLAQRHTD